MINRTDFNTILSKIKFHVVSNDKQELYMYYATIDDDKKIGSIRYMFINENHEGIDYTEMNELDYEDYIPDGKFCFISSLYVEKEYRSIGLGKVLIDYVETEAKKLNYSCIYLLASPISADLDVNYLIKYYKNLGFQYISGNNQEANMIKYI